MVIHYCETEYCDAILSCKNRNECIEYKEILERVEDDIPVYAPLIDVYGLPVSAHVSKIGIKKRNRNPWNSPGEQLADI